MLLSWIVLTTLLLGLAVAAFAGATRRAELARIARGVTERDLARASGSHQARLQYPLVDLSRCIGCGVCVAACPEEGVLEMVHGQALVVHGARCVGHGRCAVECPVGAIALTLGDMTERRDIPALTEHREAVGSPGLFLAGEVTGYALVRTAVEHGTAVAREVARRSEAVRPGTPPAGDVHDLVVVGAGPAGIACSLEATRLGLPHVLLEQEELGGTVAKYPRRKLVMTQPLDLPLHGRLSRTTYLKEELVELWNELAVQHRLPLRTGRTLHAIERAGDGTYLVKAGQDVFRARNVVLALGRRGTPRKLGVPGEELPKVAYGLIDAQSYSGRRVLVVGGGDSAVEAAVGLSEQPGNEVTLSYRKHAFFRLKSRNDARLGQAVREGRVRLVLQSHVRRILPDAVELAVADDEGEALVRLENDDVFVLAGGIPPFDLLERAGVSFDPADRPAEAPPEERGSGLLAALSAALVFTLAAVGWLAWRSDYYGLPVAARTAHPDHGWLRPARGLGLALGYGAAAFMSMNLLYLVRRAIRLPIRFGSLRAWMTAHVATGIGALLLVVVHAGLAPRQTVGGHALAGLVVLVCTGAIGRYLYAFVPRAANGRELELDEVRDRLGNLSEEWDRGQRAFGEEVRAEVQRLVEESRLTGSVPARMWTVFRGNGRLRRTLHRLEREGRAQGVAEDRLAETLSLARRAHRTSVAAAHYEEVRGLLASWRYFHRWVALLTVLLVIVHVVTAVRFGGILGGDA